MNRTAMLAGIGMGLLAASASAQYSIKSSVIAGGGGTASGGQYTLSGTIGQAAAFGPPLATGGSYGHGAGFWWTVLNCPADLNGDGVVDLDDFVPFVSAYNLFLCSEPGMPVGCPADFNGDQQVDNDDFLIFVAAYNEFLCP